MVKYPITWTKKATNDLQYHFDFLCKQQERDQARKIVKAVVEKVEILETQPRASQEEPYLRRLKRTYRRLIDYQIS